MILLSDVTLDRHTEQEIDTSFKWIQIDILISKIKVNSISHRMH